MLKSMKEEIKNNTIIVGDFNTPLTPMDRSTKQKINKETQNLNDTMDQLDLIYIYRIFHPRTINFNFFSSAHGNFSRIDQILGHKSQLSPGAQSCPTLCDPINCSMPGLPVHHQLPEFTQTHVHRVSDAIQPSHPLSSPSPPAPNPSQH